MTSIRSPKSDNPVVGLARRLLLAQEAKKTERNRTKIKTRKAGQDMMKVVLEEREAVSHNGSQVSAPSSELAPNSWSKLTYVIGTSVMIPNSR